MHANAGPVPLAHGDGTVSDRIWPANFEGANLSGADFTGANLKSARLAGADTTRTVLAGAVLTDTELERLITIRGRRRG
jgi:uncharacterized protein YjbI with pentapeptide repeats